MGHPLTLNEVYAHVHYEEGQHGVMIPIPSVEKSALVSSSSRGCRGSFMGRDRCGRSTYSSNDRDRLKCEHCGHFRHIKDQCWDLHGYPPDLTPHFSPHGGFGNGQGGGRPSEQRLSAHSITSTPTKLSTMTLALLPPRLLPPMTLALYPVMGL